MADQTMLNHPDIISADLATLRDQPGLFGPVASHATAWRTIAGLAPSEYRRPQAGDDRSEAARSVLVRADAPGASHWFAEECRDSNAGYSLGFYLDHRVRDALLLVQEEDWEPAVEPGGRRRPGAEVAELTRGRPAERSRC